METHLAEFLKGTPQGDDAEAILRSCVHCGFCTATCPTYQLLGDELDGPRGRIYLMKQVMEGATPSRDTQVHLDRCLTCRSCETTCPSGVRYGHLVDIGRAIVDARVERPLRERVMRRMLREGLTRRWLFDPAMRTGQWVRPLLPAALKAKVPARHAPGRWPRRTHPCRVLLPAGCVQPAMMPGIDAATARVLDALGIQAVVARGSGCCGAIRHHLSDSDGALDDARRNIDAWWPSIGTGEPGADRDDAPRVEAIVVNASGCGAMIADYGHLLRDDPDYAAKAVRVASLVRDLSVYLAPQRERLAALVRVPDDAPRRIAFHPPCTLQHGQQVRGAVEALLAACGAELVPFADAHLCCGSAGTYAVLQAGLSTQLRDRKLLALQAGAPQAILSANIGCITQLQSGTTMPVRHWIEWIDRAIASPA